MLAKISSEQLTEWMADYALEPWGEDRLKHYLAALTCETVNAQRLKTFAKPEDFLLDFSPDRSPEAQLEKAKKQLIQLTLALGGTVQ